MKEELMEKIEKIMNNDSETIREVLVDFLKKQVEELESNEPKTKSNYEEAKKLWMMLSKNTLIGIKSC